MNSVKNAIVTMTLLAVGYGAYVVLSSPAPDELDELAAVDAWTAPDVTTPGIGSEVPVSVEIPPAAGASDERASFAPPPVDDGGYREQRGEAMDPATDASYPPPSLAPTPYPYGSVDNSHLQGDRPLDESPEAGDSGDESGSYYGVAAVPDDRGGDYPSTQAPALPPYGALNPPQGSDPASEATSPTDSGFQASWQSAQADLANGQLGNALLTLSAWYGEPSFTETQRRRYRQLLDQLAGTVLYSRDSFLEPAHVVQEGETLENIARQYSVSSEFLARINGVEAPYQLYPGESLKVLRGPFRVEVDRQLGELTLFLGRYYAGRFAARLGPELPEGEKSFEIIAIEPGREFFSTRTGNRIRPDDPENPYGSHWIGLRGDQVTAAHHVGIHVDTGHPEGCIAVSEQDAEDLAAILTIGARVNVR